MYKDSAEGLVQASQGDFMSMSLDGFIAGPNESPDNPLGDGEYRHHEWGHGTGVDRKVFEEMMSTGSVLAGRGAFEPAGGWNGDHHDGVPIFILSRHEPSPEFAEGRRLFEHLGTEQRQLEPIRMEQGRDATHLRYRVRR